MPQAITVILSIMLLIAIPAYAAAPATTKNDESQIIGTDIGDYRYEIPSAYFDAPAQTDCHNKTALLKALLPNFEMMGENNWKDFWVINQFGRRTGILISDHTTPSYPKASQGLQVSFDNAIENNNLPLFKLPEKYNGLEVYHTPLRPELYADPNNPPYSNQVFVHRKDKEVLGFIKCSPLGTSFNPMCAQRFTYHNLEVKFHYPFSWLPIWDKLQATLVKKLDEFRKEEITTRKTACCESYECVSKIIQQQKGEK